MTENKKRLFPGPNMERGSKGPAVAVLQVVLKGWFEPRRGSGLSVIEIDVEVNGIFDEQTEALVRYFQMKNGLEVDGKCGPATRARIRGETGIVLNGLLASAFEGETVTVPPDKWPD